MAHLSENGQGPDAVIKDQHQHQPPPSSAITVAFSSPTARLLACARRGRPYFFLVHRRQRCTKTRACVTLLDTCIFRDNDSLPFASPETKRGTTNTTDLHSIETAHRTDTVRLACLAAEQRRSESLSVLRPNNDFQRTRTGSRTKGMSLPSLQRPGMRACGSLSVVHAAEDACTLQEKSQTCRQARKLQHTARWQRIQAYKTCRGLTPLPFPVQAVREPAFIRHRLFHPDPEQGTRKTAFFFDDRRPPQ